jgi:hypothetical protein
MVVALMTDGNLVCESRYLDKQIWLQALGATTATRARLARGQLLRDPLAFPPTIQPRALRGFGYEMGLRPRRRPQQD